MSGHYISITRAMSSKLNKLRMSSLVDKVLHTTTSHSKNFSNESPVVEATAGPLSKSYMAIMKHMSYSHTIDAMETESIIHTPGLFSESYDRDGNPSMPSLMKYMTFARVYSAHLPLDHTGRTLFDWAQMTSDRFTFVASSEITTEKPLYKVSVSKCPLDIRFKLGYIGKASFSTVATALDPSTGKTLLRNINHMVGIDKATRRPKPLPDWWIEKHRSSAILKEPLRVPRLQRPEHAFPNKVRVAWTDTDTYNHTNYTSYSHFSINALHRAIERGAVTSMSKGDVKRGIQSMRNTYIGESLENDDLTVYVWASETLDNTVHFDIQKNGNSIFQSTFVYHR